MQSAGTFQSNRRSASDIRSTETRAGKETSVDLNQAIAEVASRILGYNSLDLCKARLEGEEMILIHLIRTKYKLDFMNSLRSRGFKQSWFRLYRLEDSSYLLRKSSNSHLWASFTTVFKSELTSFEQYDRSIAFIGLASINAGAWVFLR